MGQFPNSVTTERACEVLGITKRELLELLAQEKLTWTTAADKRTTLIELPVDVHRFLRELRGHRQSLSAWQAAAELSVARSTVYVFLREGRLKIADGEGNQITRDSVEQLKADRSAKRNDTSVLNEPVVRNRTNRVFELDPWSQPGSK